MTPLTDEEIRDALNRLDGRFMKLDPGPAVAVAPVRQEPAALPRGHTDVAVDVLRRPPD